MNELLPRPDLLLIETWSQGVYLFRLTAGGEYAGDTWHESIVEAQQQAEYEYGEALAEWQVVPEEVQGVSAIVGWAASSG